MGTLDYLTKFYTRENITPIRYISKTKMGLATFMYHSVTINNVPYIHSGKLYSELGLIYSSIKSFSSGMECFEHALTAIQKIPQKSKALQSEASILQNIGAAYNEREMFTEAAAYHQEAIAIHGRFSSVAKQARDDTRHTN